MSRSGAKPSLPSPLTGALIGGGYGSVWRAWRPVDVGPGWPDAEAHKSAASFTARDHWSHAVGSGLSERRLTECSGQIGDREPQLRPGAPLIRR